MFIQANQPFDFRKSIAFAGGDSPLRTAFEIDELCVLATVREAPGGVEATFEADVDLDDSQLRAASDRVAFYLSLHDELGTFYARAQSDRAFAPLLERGYGFHQVKFASPFEAACWSILTQRVDVRIARRVKDRLAERFGTSIARDGVTYRAFPSAARLGRCSDEALLAAGVQDRRLRYLRSAIDAFTAVGACVQIRETVGLGESVLEAARAVYGPISAATMHTLANLYGEHAGYWLFYLRAVPALSPTSRGAA